MEGGLETTPGDMRHQRQCWGEEMGEQQSRSMQKFATPLFAQLRDGRAESDGT